MSERVCWKDSDLVEVERTVQNRAARLEPAWDGMGERPELRIWRIEKFHVVPWPKERYGAFHRGDSYIVLNTYTRGSSDALYHDIHIWIGNESSQDEYGTAAYKMVEADNYLGGIPVQHRQVEGHESEAFHSYFSEHPLEYLEGGVESGFRHVEPTPEKPFLFRVKGTRKKMSLSQMPMRKTSLNEGDSFILYGGKARVWCWHGKHARGLEKASSNAWAETMCTMGTVVTLDQGDGDEECNDFWQHLQDDGEIGPDLQDDEEEVTVFRPQLYRVDGDLSVPLQKVAQGIRIKRGAASKRCIHRTFLDEDDVFLLYCGWELFVWIGKDADAMEKLAAMKAADRFAKQEPKAANIPLTVVKSGRETDAFLAFFADESVDLTEDEDESESAQKGCANSEADLWERPSWAAGGGQSMLKATVSGEKLKTSGNLALPITNIRDVYKNTVGRDDDSRKLP